MPNFYDGWLDLWKKSTQERKKAKKVIYPEELKWVKTRQDYKVALLVSPETGFKTIGAVTMLGEIPEGWKTGKHSHGEEAMYILKGKGFSIVNEKRYDWEEGACLRIPFGAVHQHFNQGTTPVQFYAALAPHLEYFCHVAKFEQLEDCGKIDDAPKVKSTGDHDEKGRRIVLHRKDAPVSQFGEERKIRAEMKDFFPPGMEKTQRVRNYGMMGSLDDFRGDEVEITNVFVDNPRTATHKHAHMEAMLYVLQGEGYSEIDDERITWKPGTAIHIQGPQTVHQHFVTSSVESHMIRTHFGIRKWMQPIAKPTFPYLFFEEGGKPI